MRKAGVFILLLLMALPILLTAQDDDDPYDGYDGSDWDYYYDDFFTRGDQTFIISLGTVFPTLFFSNGSKIDHKLSPPVGGTGSLAYNYYLTSKIFVGAELGGMFIHTLGSNTLFTIPVGLRGGYQFNFWRLEFPITGVVGMVWHRYLNEGNYSLYLKAGGAVFFRAHYNWSFGLNSNWFWFPQWTEDPSKNVYGNMLDLTLSARYHF